MRRGFTILELLVVTTMIVVMLSMMAPALEKGIRSAEVVFCGSNEYALGSAINHWLIDNRGFYPTIEGPGMSAGNRGTVDDMRHDQVGVNDRPLNSYLGYISDQSQVFVAECPADLGDIYTYDTPGMTEVNNAYEAYGSSYMEAVNSTRWRIKPVFGIVEDPERPSLRSTQLRRFDNKILLADWAFDGDRRWSSSMTRWHSDDKRRFNVLFADLRVDFFTFPDEAMDNPANENQTPNAGYYWW